MKNFIVLAGVLFFSSFLYAQNIGINTTGALPDSSAALDVNVNDKGMLIPRLTTMQRDSIQNPVHSLLIFNTTIDCFESYDSNTASWHSFGCLICPLPSAPTILAGTDIYFTSFNANWQVVSGAIDYYLDIATDSLFLNMIPGFNNLNVGNGTTYNVTGLSCGAEYFYRVRTEDVCGTSTDSNFEKVIMNNCIQDCGVITDVRDGQTYNTAQIGTQCWMRENLNYNASGSWCYGDNSTNCSTFGRLYSWNTIMAGAGSSTANPSGVQGVCPSGWHLPSDAEWTVLNNFLATAIGEKMKEIPPVWDGTNSSGFSALPAGFRNANGAFFDLNSDGYWWSATENGANAWGRYISSASTLLYRGNFEKTRGWSVRCVKDPPPCPTPTAPTSSAGSNTTQTSFNANWQAISGAISYVLDVATDPAFTNTLPGFNGLNVGVVTSYSITSLVCNSDYYYRVRALNSCGSSVNSVTIKVTTNNCPPPFNCGTTLVDTRDSKSYSTVQIGSQCWMKENLNFAPSSGNSWCHSNDGNNCNNYGRLYDWNTAMAGANSSNANPSGVQGVCPSGWHLPSDSEWTALDNYLAPSSGTKMKVAAPVWDGNNTSGFSALPGGYMDNVGGFYGVNTFSYWWSSTQSSNNAWYRRLGHSDADMYRYMSGKDYGYYIRCVLD